MKYRKKPVVIEAVQYNEHEGLKWSECPEWLLKAFKNGVLYYDFGHNELGNNLRVKSLEGDHHVSSGDYIIRGVKGELYACKPDIFEQTYEVVTND